MTRILLLSVATLVMSSASPLVASAHDQHSHTVERPAPEDPQLRVEKITDNLHVLFGSGGNIGVSSGPDGVVLIDDKFARNAEEILYHVQQIAGENDNLLFVINTHLHGDHTGSNPEMKEAGAMIMAHENVRTRMGTSYMNKAWGRMNEAKNEDFWPVVTFTDQASLHFNGITARSIHVPSAHTDGDTIVLFEEPNVVHMGDNLFLGMFPFVDVDSGGSMQGMIAAHDKVLAMADADTVIIPGHGPITDRDGLTAARDRLQAIYNRVSEHKMAGKSLQEIIDAEPLADMADLDGFIDQGGIITAAWRSMGGDFEGPSAE
ncbi:MBL fold metallo-hydrolase [Algimonas porphyrae]|uniref:Cyclase n=1 Tax=Algimonas porphyrae TaxID=1128113 RepID=A0ABQ5V220_9PROT|nr:MBL fold metallo-hydrolase [Algimonas porphyrae]GLQ21603.1 cyclase [Algimonas porphyrae]